MIWMVLVGVLLIGAGFVAGAALAGSKNSIDESADPEYLRDLVSHYRAELDNAVEVNRVLTEQRDAARSALNASVECQIDYLERLELAERGGR